MFIHLVGTIGKRGEKPKIAPQHQLAPTSEERRRGQAANIQIGGCARQSQNMDQGFDRLVGHFKPIQPVAAALCVEEVLDREKGRAVFMQQGNHVGSA
jgi:hypothetical protein